MALRRMPRNRSVLASLTCTSGRAAHCRECPSYIEDGGSSLLANPATMLSGCLMAGSTLTCSCNALALHCPGLPCPLTDRVHCAARFRLASQPALSTSAMLRSTMAPLLSALPASPSRPPRLTRLLVPCAGTWTTELLWLAASRVGDEEGPVVADEGLLQLECLCRILVLCGVGDDGFSDRLADGVDLRSVSTSRNADPDVDVGERCGLEHQDLRPTRLSAIVARLHSHKCRLTGS